MDKNLVKEFSKITFKVSIICLFANIILFIIKLMGGILSHSESLISDAINSIFDVLSTLIIVIGAKIANKKPDKQHPYGHERYESVATIILSIILLITAIFMGHTSIESLLNSSYINNKMPGILAIISAIVSIIIKEILFWYTKTNADKINSVSLKAEAWDHRSDVISTLGALIGIILSRYGFYAGDIIASLIVCAFIIRTAIITFAEAISQMVDKSCDDVIIKEIKKCAKTVNGVLSIDLIHVRTFGSRLYVDLEISADGNMKLFEAHSIAEDVHNKIEKEFPLVKHVMIHVNPKMN